jgi:cytochrome P450
MTVATVEQHLDFVELDIDPYPTYARLRREAPVAYLPELDLWLLTRWDDCESVASDRQRWPSPAINRLNRSFGTPNLLTTSGDEHQLLRDAVDPPLRPRSVNGYIEDLVRPIAQSVIRELSGAGQAELISQYLEPVSVLGLGALLGLGDLDANTLRRWFHDLVVGAGNLTDDPANYEICDEASAEIEAYVDPILDVLERHPDDSVLSHLLHDGMPDGQVRPRSAVYPTYKIIIAGGMQEPGHGAGTTMLGLLTNPEQLQRLVADPRLVGRAVSEGLRWIAPIGQAVRSPVADTEVRGVVIPRGATVHASLASANRDEAQFSSADEFDIDRTSSHMAFGHGEHFCSGHFFARQLERIAIAEIISAFPSMEVDPERATVVRGWLFRAPRELPVRWRD